MAKAYVLNPCLATGESGQVQVAEVISYPTYAALAVSW